MKLSLSPLLYACGWIIAWFVLSTIIDYGLVVTNVYEAGEKGKFITYSLGAVISFAGAFSLHNEVFPE